MTVELDLEQVHPTTARMLCAMAALQKRERRGDSLPTDLFGALALATAAWVAVAGPDRDHPIASVRAALGRIWDFSGKHPVMAQLVAEQARGVA